MLSPAAHAALSPACLRCQLRGIIKHLSRQRRPQRALRLPSRTFSTRHLQQDDTWEQQTGRRQDGELLHRRIRLDTEYRHIHPQGRIIGKGKRRQRQLSEPLTINSLGESSSVIVMRDVPNELQETLLKSGEGILEGLEADDGSGGKKVILTAEEIEASLSSTPEQKDVNTSLDAMRPEDTIVDEATFDGLLHRLLDGYNLQQLSLYLQSHLASKRLATVLAQDPQVRLQKSQKIVAFQKSRWQPGITPLEKRRLTKVAGTPKALSTGAKARVAEQVLRIAWDLTISTEEQASGELELKLSHWQVALLFDVKVNGKPRVESLISSELLSRSSKIEVHRPDSVLRITARRHDAEEIAKRLEMRLMSAGTTQILAGVLRQHHNKQAHRLLRDEDIAMIQEKTQAILQVPPQGGTIIIYGLTGSARIEARRLLLSLLYEPSRIIKTTNLMLSGAHRTGRSTPVLLPVLATSALHYRDRSKQFGRIVRPSRRDSLSTAQESAALNLDSLQFRSSSSSSELPLAAHISAESLSNAKHAQRLSPRASSGTASGSYFGAADDAKPSRWKAQLGLMLQPLNPQITASLESAGLQFPSTARNSASRMLFSPGAGFETALSYFTPRKRRLAQQTTDELEAAPEVVKRTNVIIAHFMPSPFGLTKKKANIESLPRIRLSFLRRHPSKLHAKDSHHADALVQLQSIKAIFETEHINVSLPAHATDLRLTRHTVSKAKSALAAEDDAIKEFTAGLDWSLKNGHTLFGKSEVNFKIPSSWIVDPSKKATATSEGADTAQIPYIFERFESKQSTDYLPNREAIASDLNIDPAARDCFAAMPQGAVVRYTETDAGMMGGQQTQLAVCIESKVYTKIQGGELADSKLEGVATEAGVHNTLATAALSLVELVTRASRGVLQPLRVRRVPLQEQWDAE